MTDVAARGEPAVDTAAQAPADGGPGPAAGQPPASQPSRSRRVALPRPATVLQVVATPLLVILALVLLYAWVGAQELDSIEARSLQSDIVVQRAQEHFVLTAIASGIVVLLGVPAGVLLSRSPSRVVDAVVLGIGNLGQATPAIGLLVILTILFQPGIEVALVSLSLYALLPVMRNTFTGIRQVDPAIVEAATGMGMSSWGVLTRVELRMAVPVILAGIRTALVFVVGVATLAVFVNAGGLGDFLVTGIKLQRDVVLITGAVLTASVAFFVDWVGAQAESALTPRGLR